MGNVKVMFLSEGEFGINEVDFDIEFEFNEEEENKETMMQMIKTVLFDTELFPVKF